MKTDYDAINLWLDEEFKGADPTIVTYSLSETEWLLLSGTILDCPQSTA